MDHVLTLCRGRSTAEPRISDDPIALDRVFNLAHEKERASDPERKGRAVIVDLDEVKGVLGFRNLSG